MNNKSNIYCNLVLFVLLSFFSNYTQARNQIIPRQGVSEGEEVIITSDDIEMHAVLYKPLGMDRTSYIYVLQERFENKYAYGHDKDQDVITFDQADEAGAAGSLALLCQIIPNSWRLF